MNLPVRADSVQAKLLGLTSVRLSISNAATQQHAQKPNQGFFITAVALGFGGALTLVWAIALLWIAGYLIGLW
jgi:hypothetical protein